MMRHFRAVIFPGGAALALLAVAVVGIFAPFPSEELSENAPVAERITTRIQNRTEPAPAALAASSPFVIAREPYSRPVIAPEPAPPPPRRNVVIELIGIVVENGERSAVVLLDGVERTLKLGDQTEAGRVAFIGLDSVRFEGEQTRMASLFE